MVFEVDRHSGVPAYRHVMDQVRYAIASGALEPGAELPSTRRLSSDLGLNPMTVSKAYSLLERDGVVERRPGRSLVVRARSGSELSADRGEQLRVSLADATRTARQLGIAPREALRIFRALLEGTNEEGS